MLKFETDRKKGGTKHTFNVTGFNYAFILREIGYILSR